MAVSTGKREWRQLDQVRSKTCNLDCGRRGFKLRQQGPIPKMTLTQVGSQKVINFNHWGNDYRHVYFIHFKIKLKCSGCSVLVSHVRLFATPWTVAHQAPLSTGFSWQEYWSW